MDDRCSLRLAALMRRTACCPVMRRFRPVTRRLPGPVEGLVRRREASALAEASRAALRRNDSKQRPCRYVSRIMLWLSKICSWLSIDWQQYARMPLCKPPSQLPTLLQPRSKIVEIHLNAFPPLPCSPGLPPRKPGLAC